MLRLLVSLLALLLAFPASAAPACHESPAAAAAASMKHHEHRPAAPARAATHDCLGCVPPLDLAGGMIVSPLRPTERPRPPMRASTTAGALLVPLSPPPRAA